MSSFSIRLQLQTATNIFSTCVTKHCFYLLSLFVVGPLRFHDGLVGYLVPLPELAGALSLSISFFGPWRIHMELAGTLVLPLTHGSSLLLLLELSIVLVLVSDLASSMLLLPVLDVGRSFFMCFFLATPTNRDWHRRNGASILPSTNKQTNPRVQVLSTVDLNNH